MNEELDNFVGNDEVDNDVTVETTADTQDEAENITAEVQQETTSKKGEEDDAPPASTEEHQETMIPLAAKQAEKERRKQVEEQLRQVQLELARYQGAQQAQQTTTQPKIDPPDPYTQPEEYTNHVLNSREQARAKVMIESSEELARMEYTDYDENANFFIDKVAPNNPALVQKMLNSADPARFAYLTGKAQKKSYDEQSRLQQAGGLENYEKQLREKIIAELAAKKPAVDIPPDLTSVRNTGSDPKAEEIAEGTDGLLQMLGR